MKVQKFKCMLDGGNEADQREYWASCPEHAAEYYAEDVWSDLLDDLIGEVQVNVDTEDGEEFEVPVVIERPSARFRAKN